MHCPNVNTYCVYSCNKDSERAQGGVLIAIKNNIKHELVNLPLTSFECVAVKTNFPFPLTICNLYISPNMNLNILELRHLINSLEKPFLLLGDFNAHSDTWGSLKNTRRGNEINDLFDSMDLVIKNSGQHTHFSPSYNTFSCIDLTITNSSIASRFDWNVIEDLHGSDHFPISLDLLTNKIERTKRPKWRLDEANWELFSTLTTINCSTNLDTTIDELVTSFSNLIIQSASESIPRTSSKSKRVPVPWWSDEIKIAIKFRRKALKDFKQSPTSTNLIKFKQTRAKARYLIKQSRKKSWEEYVQSISIHTSIKDVFNKIKRISGISKFNGDC